MKIDNNLPDIIRPQDFKKNELTDKITLIEEEKEVIEK